MREYTLQINTKSVGARIGMILLMSVVLVFAWFSVRWQFGNMLGETTSPSDPGASQVAAMAKELNPHDPFVSWLVASAGYDVTTPESINAYTTALEGVVRQAPYDNRWWIELGRAYEQSGDAGKAEKAFLRAIELAPRYTYPHWQFGNFLLRAGRADEALRELKLSAQESVVYRDQVFAVAWDFFDRDTAKMDELASGSPEMLAGLTRFYAAREKAEEAFAAWSRMTPDERHRQVEIGALVARALFEKRYFRSAAEFVRTLDREPEVEVGKIVNGGFETPLAENPDSLFCWYVIRRDKVEVRQDQIVKKAGQRSLRMNFKGFSGTEFVNLFQAFAVDGGASYRMRFFVRTEDLRSQSPVSVEIAGVQSALPRASEVIPGILAKFDFPVGTNDWQEVVLEFVVPDGAEGLQVRVNRNPCGEGCLLFGSIWLDEMSLERTR